MEGWVTVAVAQGMVQAQLIKGRLESAGIRVILRYESIGQIYAVTVNGLGEVAVVVPKEELDYAREILSSL
ncbi:MAG TPA: DUF2007 domain-containing protein [Syntrophales bacterium]|nr:DUF2007 domain-containing protein [Syntrophales bacterium]HOL59554.1 DUF2007 domain-containing protein [Syntrophales bacterium]HPO35644.1 DUF2007 domain-containing protein [Syntrophales bacterium]